MGKKKEKKDKKSKKRKEVESDVEEKSEVDSDEELYRFFEDPPESKPQKRKSKEQVSPADIKKKFVRAKFDNDLDLLDEDLDTDRQKKSKIKRRTSNEGSLDEESSDLLEKMRRKNEKRLKRTKETDRDKMTF